jgi:hypothetical protein
VEKEVEGMIAGYEDAHYLHNIRNRLLIKRPPDVRKILRADEKAEEKKAKEKRKNNPFGGLKDAKREGTSQ